MVKSPEISLRDALRSARLDEGLRTDAILAGREADYLRLAQLNEQLAPIFKEIPSHIDMFDIGLVAGDRPRLWIDMVSFIELNRDNRNFRFYKDSHDGRKLLAEHADPAVIVKVITQYIARRIVARERLLETDSPTLQPQDEAKQLPEQGSILDRFSNAVQEEKAIKIATQNPNKRRNHWLIIAILSGIILFLLTYFAK